jgi:hypothetical protein
MRTAMILTWYCSADGWFITFLFAIVLPSPSFYYFFNGINAKPGNTQLETEFGQYEEENPLAIDSGDGQDGSTQQPPAARAKMFKLQREVKEKAAEIQQLRKRLAKSETKLKDTLQADRDHVEDLVADVEMLDAADTDAPAKTQVDAMKEFVADESLSEEARESAKKALGMLVTSQIVETEHVAEQVAQNNLRSRQLDNLRSKVQFNDEFAKFSGQFVSSKYKDTMPKERCSDEMAEWLHSQRLLHHAAAVNGVAGT